MLDGESLNYDKYGLVYLLEVDCFLTLVAIHSDADLYL